MKKQLLRLLFGSLIFVLVNSIPVTADDSVALKKCPVNELCGGEYAAVIEGFDWGCAVSKVVLSMDKTVTSANWRDFTVFAERSTELTEIPADSASGDRMVVYGYVSDAEGNVVPESKYITLVLQVGPDLPLGSSMLCIGDKPPYGNCWIDYRLTVKMNGDERVWNKETDRVMPVVDEFDLSGKFEYDDKISLTYASFRPKIKQEKSPLIIWLHGGGEGGTDTTIPLLANKVTNYASEEIQIIFGGAHVLVPQTPTFWMQNAQGDYTVGEVDDVYNQALMALIKDFVAKNPTVDSERIYLGGCSNGGYMTIKLLLLYPDYFAAAFPSALAYHSEFLTDEQIKSIAHMPIWFVHSKDDKTTDPEKTAVPVYQRLIKAGADNVHFSFFDHVIDLTGLFGGENYHFYGHCSWNYCHANKCLLDFDGSPVLVDEKPVTIMEWMAAQRRL